MYERAFPGMPRPDIISEHCSRYAFALSLVGGAHVLDLGCGTGYGSEMLSWSAARCAASISGGRLSTSTRGGPA
jgi:cyclopropane fatty-acyl-phospholipid synthase-like methyltransferase